MYYVKFTNKTYNFYWLTICTNYKYTVRADIIISTGIVFNFKVMS